MKANEIIKEDASQNIDSSIDIAKAVNMLPNNRLKDVIEMRFKHDMTFDEIGKELGVGKDRARQIVMKALRHLRHPKYGLTDDIVEGKFRSDDIEEFKPSNAALDDLKSKYLPDWEMLDHRTIQAKYVAKDHRHAEQFVKFINRLSEKMDHFAEVTQDVAEVAVKTSTFDVKGLTLLDFQLAMIVDNFAAKNDIEQVRMSGNFGMHENFADGKVKGKSRPGRVKRAGASCNGSVTDLRKRAKNASGEKAKMYHWCANMKGGKK